MKNAYSLTSKYYLLFSVVFPRIPFWEISQASLMIYFSSRDGYPLFVRKYRTTTSLKELLNNTMKLSQNLRQLELLQITTTCLYYWRFAISFIKISNRSITTRDVLLIKILISCHFNWFICLAKLVSSGIHRIFISSCLCPELDKV